MPDHFYVYPAYLDGATPRALGRRVSTGDAAPNVTLAEVVAAALSLGVKVTAEPDKQYPPRFFTYAGRAKVPKKAGLTKTKFLRDLAKEIHRRRAAEKKP
jgi:signal recognition particle subunit SEC65